MSDVKKNISRRSFIKSAATGGFALIVGGVYIGQVNTAAAYSWTRTLTEGMTGNDVRELQIRVAGWAADSSAQTFVAVDGSFGSGTKAAVIRFQRAYGLTADGVVGPQTQSVLNSLASSDGSTVNFNWVEFHSKDGSGFNGGRVGATTVQENVRRLMYKLEALRRKAGSRAITINSGFRSITHNANIGGASNSAHLYGIAADIVVSGLSPDQVRPIAGTCGFSGLITYNRNNLFFNHVDSRIEYSYGQGGWYWAYNNE